MEKIDEVESAMRGDHDAFAALAAASVDRLYGIAFPIAPNDRGALTAAGAAGHVLYVTDRTTLIAIDVATGRRIGASPLPGYPIDMVVLGGDPWVLTDDGSLTHLHQEGG